MLIKRFRVASRALMVVLVLGSLGGNCLTPAPPSRDTPTSCTIAGQQIVCGRCVATAYINQPCTTDLCNGSGAVCIGQAPGARTCQIASGATMGLCSPAPAVSEPCTQNTDCPAECIGGMCQPGGQSCTSSADCQYRGPLRCSGGTCQAAQGITQACSPTQPCSTASYCFDATVPSCAPFLSRRLRPLDNSPIPDQSCQPFVLTDGQACDSSYNSPMCAPCGPGLTCSGSVCRRPCPNGDMDCPTSAHCASGYCTFPCVDTQNDVYNCGACGNACQGVFGGYPVCRNGRCDFACTAPYRTCSTTCASFGGECLPLDTTSACGNQCLCCEVFNAFHNYCTVDAAGNGTCTFDCHAGYHPCPTQGCVADNDSRFCGASCTFCASPAHGSAYCFGGACGKVCNHPGFTTPCGDTCVDALTDSANCGGCGITCPGACDNGVCASNAPPACTDFGVPCLGNADCCSGMCTSGFCTGELTCYAPGEDCSSGQACCNTYNGGLPCGCPSDGTCDGCMP